MYVLMYLKTLILLKAKDGVEPSFVDLQSNTLPLCYLASLTPRCAYGAIGAKRSRYSSCRVLKPCPQFINTNVVIFTSSLLFIQN